MTLIERPIEAQPGDGSPSVDVADWIHGLTISDLSDEVAFRDQMELDSMDFLDIVMELRKLYRIQIPEEDYEHLISMSSTVSYLEPRLKDVAVA